MFQFIHVETYALKASTKQRPVKPPKDGKAPINPPKVKNKYSAGQIIDEVLREPDAIPHVANPEKPNFILGSEDDLRTLIPRIEAAAASYKNPKDGRKLRSDAHVLLAGVASYPREAAEDNPSNYEKWKAKTVDFLREKYGDKLVSVVEHQDESHPHLHFYCVDFENLNAKMLHDGHRAAAQLPQLSKEAGLAFKGAMREYQNNYYQNVGAQVGLTRIGPGRKRATRQEWNAQKAEAKELAKAYEATSEIVNEATLQAQSIVNETRQERIKLEQERRDFEVEQITFYEKRRELIAAMKKAKEFQAQLHDVEVIQKSRHEMLLKQEKAYQEKLRLTDDIRLRLTDDYLREHGIGLHADMVDVDFTQTNEWLDMCDPTKAQNYGSNDIEFGR
ncbi:plasmid recombination protein [Acidovorax sp.]|uniref:plasmid recombination protein n=1 Tax=Acidovorax sp. TaxID=1872122 RepID=UPI0040380235